MYKKYLFFWMFMFFFIQNNAQVLKVVSNEQLALFDTRMSYNPIISPTGDYILLTAPDSIGLCMYDLQSNRLIELNSDKGAGFDAKISEDGKLVAYRSQRYINQSYYTTLKVLNIESKKIQSVVRKSLDIEGYAFQDGTILVIEDGKISTKRILGNIIVKKPPVSSIKRGQLYMTLYSQTSLISPAGTKNNYLWTSVSPDRKKLLYYVIELDQAFVSDIDGRNAVS